MGVGLIIAAVTIGATVATTLFAKGPRSTKGADMAPANLDAFRLTTAEEGTVIPRVFGTVRLPGNLLYYGNLSSEPEYEETTVGGKDGYGVAVVQAKYEHAAVTFTLSYTPEGKLGGLFFK